MDILRENMQYAQFINDSKIRKEKILQNNVNEMPNYYFSKMILDAQVVHKTEETLKATKLHIDQWNIEISRSAIRNMSASVGTSARRRKPISSAKKSQLESNDSYFDSKTKKHLPYLPSIFTWALLIGLHLGIFLLVHWRVHSFPYQVDSSEASLETHHFYESNARVHLNTLFSFGPRVTGSNANEIYAKEYITSVIDKIKVDVHPTKKMSIDVQNVSGSFHMENILGTEYYSVYRNLKNIVVKLDPKDGRIQFLDVVSNALLLYPRVKWKKGKKTKLCTEK
ncbi:hypothetical protein KUTeg_016592 [Tegillarca granosa]|uniref:Uncharacterized protein n=1 Tax=Tegillarca granosa TaxID=220873 RepID=A0ABQ9EQ41_TEGGR|nr:hypothetical protein KUTeg_016592 [Tegillarca granosa]